jgi:hypothetical protein
MKLCPGQHQPQLSAAERALDHLRRSHVGGT